MKEPLILSSNQRWMKDEYDRLIKAGYTNSFLKKVCPYCEGERYFDIVSTQDGADTFVCCECINEFKKDELG